MNRKLDHNREFFAEMSTSLCTVGRGVKGRWGVKGHLQNDSYQAMYMHHDNVVYHLQKYDIYDCLNSFCLSKLCLFFKIWVK